MESTKLSWSWLAWRGVVSLLFGIGALAWPGVTLTALAFAYGAYAISDGITALVVALQRSGREHRWALVLDGVLGVGAGLTTFLWPGVTLYVLVLLIGARAIGLGALQIGAAVQLRHAIPAPFLYGIAGLASIVFGVLTFFVPIASATLLVTMLGIYAVAFGIALLALAIKMRPSHTLHGGAAAT
jgi:uncharacterized membrane protein HdeD (DUF308 family)